MAISEELKAKMAEGRRRALEAKRAAREADPVEMAKKAADEGLLDVPKPFLKPGHVHADPPVLPIAWPKQAADPLLGITSEDCCIDCNMDRCVISGKPYCAHPRKCGLAPVDKVNPETMARYNRARKVLIHADIDRQP